VPGGEQKNREKKKKKREDPSAKRDTGGKSTAKWVAWGVKKKKKKECTLCEGDYEAKTASPTGRGREVALQNSEGPSWNL